VCTGLSSAQGYTLSGPCKMFFVDLQRVVAKSGQKWPEVTTFQLALDLSVVPENDSLVAAGTLDDAVRTGAGGPGIMACHAHGMQTRPTNK
jgi:hypothetical protein